MIKTGIRSYIYGTDKGPSKKGAHNESRHGLRSVFAGSLKNVLDKLPTFHEGAFLRLRLWCGEGCGRNCIDFPFANAQQSADHF